MTEIKAKDIIARQKSRRDHRNIRPKQRLFCPFNAIAAKCLDKVLTSEKYLFLPPLSKQGRYILRRYYGSKY